MKLNEIKSINEPEYLEEIQLKHGFASGLIGAASLISGSSIHKVEEPKKPIVSQIKQVDKKDIENLNAIANKIVKKYNIDIDDAMLYVKLAKKYEKPVWPKAKDLLAVMAVESSFDPDAISSLKYDPAVGLMQIRPKIWGMSSGSLSTPEQQIKAGVEILSKYHDKLKNPTDTLHAYNIGITNFRKQQNLNPKYAQKVQKELKTL